MWRTAQAQCGYRVRSRAGVDGESTQGLVAGVVGSYGIRELLSNTGAHAALSPGTSSVQNGPGFPNRAGVGNPESKGQVDMEGKDSSLVSNLSSLLP